MLRVDLRVCQNDPEKSKLKIYFREKSHNAKLQRHFMY